MNTEQPDSRFDAFSDQTCHPCDKCRLTTCHSLHAYSVSSCPYKICSECLELQALDAQITEIHDLLVNLSQKRHKLKEKINRRHDTFTSRVPLEVVSHIFSLTTESEPYSDVQNSFDLYSWNPVVLLGAVCRHWRDITLSLPRLWTKIRIDPCTFGNTISSPELATKWLSRSSTLPLTLDISVRNPHNRLVRPPPTLAYSNIVPLLRSHASRWKNLTLRVTLPALQMLLSGLEARLNVDSLSIQVFNCTTLGEREEISLEHPFVPRCLRIGRCPVLPFQWQRLTYLEANHISVDELLHIFGNAHNLKCCVISDLERDAGLSSNPFSPQPVVNVSTKEFDAKRNYSAVSTTNLLMYLTLPSLQTLRYIGTTYNDQREEMNMLAGFIDRSQPLLHEFYMHHVSMSGWDRNESRWYSQLPSITSLRLDIDDVGGEKLDEYLAGLNAQLKPMALPCLHELEVLAKTIHCSAWMSLAEMFPGSKDAPAIPRPLKRVIISVILPAHIEIMNKATYSCLCAIRDSGVTLKVFNEHIKADMLDPAFAGTVCELDEMINAEGLDGVEAP